MYSLISAMLMTFFSRLRPADRKPKAPAAPGQRHETRTQQLKQSMRSREVQARKDIICWECGKLGHFRREGYKLSKSAPRKMQSARGGNSKNTPTPANIRDTHQGTRCRWE
jgi:hypothetical protein